MYYDEVQHHSRRNTKKKTSFLFTRIGFFHEEFEMTGRTLTKFLSTEP